MIRILLVGVGGGIGAILRYLMSGAVQRAAGGVVFPFGTFAVNVVGCFTIGFLYFLAEAHGMLSDRSRAFLITGILGGFTTFSAFANESVYLLRDGEMLLGGLNIAGQVTLCLLATWLGRNTAFLFWR
jgi:CrcB protein